MPLEEGDQFLLESHAPVVFFLFANVSHHGGRLRMADAECAIGSLSVKADEPPVAVHPTRGISFHNPQGISRRQSGRQRP